MNAIEEITGTMSEEEIGSRVEGILEAATGEERLAVVRCLMERLDEVVPEDARERLMQARGKRCFAAHAQKSLQPHFDAAADLDDLLGRLAAGWGEKLPIWREGEFVHAIFPRCYCHVFTEAPHDLSATYCRCSCGWFRGFFEAFLGAPVDVELLSSVAQGADRCAFRIRIPPASSAVAP